MGIIKESSKVTLYSGVDITSGLQIAFQTIANQNKYFESKILTTSKANANFSYVRRTGKIKIGITAAEASKCDYMSFINPAFENKRFYAKVVNYAYVNNTTTEITYAIDYFQTYMFDVKYEQGVIEREHLSETGYQKSVEYPWRRDVYELNTAEDLKVSKEMEDSYKQGSAGDLMEPSYDTGYANFPDTQLLDPTHSVIILQIADFDTSEMTDIEDAFYSNFDMIIDSRGFVVKDSFDDITGRPEAVPLKIGRGFGIYAINGTDYTSLRKLSDAMEWITFHGLNESVIGSPYQIGYEAWNAYIYQGTHYGTKMLYVEPREYNVHNKKLLRFPYQYIRVYNNEGDCKEYKYEMFTDNIMHDGQLVVNAQFMYIALLDGAPMFTLVPFKYRRHGLNQEERIDCLQMPQIGYTTDAYLAFLASRYNQNLASRTDSLSEDLNTMIDNRAINTAKESGLNAAGSDWLSSMRNQLQSMGNVFGSILQGDVSGTVGSLMNTSAYSEREEASLWKSGGNYVYSGYFAPSEAAFVADKYHAGSANGTLGYYLKPSIPGVVSENRYAPGTFTVERVKLLDQVLAVFDTYLSGFGYTSGRYGRPRICAYMTDNEDSASPANVPHFAPYFGKQVTYVKTSNMHVDHTISEVSSSIEEMFNTGIQFLKGEDLIG